MPYPVETGICLVDLEDLAKAAALVLTEPDHIGATYELVGTGPITQVQVAAVLSDVLGKDIQAQRIPYKTWETQAIKNGLGSYQRYTLLKMFQHYKDFGFNGKFPCSQLAAWPSADTPGRLFAPGAGRHQRLTGIWHHIMEDTGEINNGE